MKQGDIQYRAFISYSHADRAVVDWLHRGLEAYRLPSKLVGQVTPLGPVPARLGSLFRDRDELPAAGDLSTELKAALKRSMFLIVVCSPAAAQSRWVNEEVRQFKLLHGHKRGDGTARVLALIVGGDPGDAEAGACFPPALKFHVLPDGSISDDPAEPIAADIRPGGDGKKLAKLKLVAGLTGLPLDALVQREAARRQRRLGLLAGASLVLTAVMAVLTLQAIEGRREAERQRAQADGLIEFMLTDLRAKLQPVGRLELLDSVGQKALAYYQAQDLAELSPDELGRRSRALHLVGEVRDLRGDSEAALKAFREAERTTGELLARDPKNPDRMFDHAQSAFWVGQVAWARRDFPTAEAKFRTYAELADAMAATAPDHPKWIAEQAYAANSLGALLLRKGDAAAAIPHFQFYVSAAERLAKAAPQELGRQFEIGQGNAWLADALVATGRLDAAVDARQRELQLYAGILAADPDHSDALSSHVNAQQSLAEIALFRGDLANAVERQGIAYGAALELLEQDQDNMAWLDAAVSAANLYADTLLLAEQLVKAEAVNSWAISAAQRLVAADSASANARRRLMGASWVQIALAYQSGNALAAREADARFREAFAATRASDISGDGSVSWALVDTMATVYAHRQGKPEVAMRHRAAALAAAGGLDHRSRAAVVLLSAPPFAPGASRNDLPPSEARYPLEKVIKPIRGP